MSINQISSSNTFGQLITTVSALVAVSNNLTDGPQSQTGSTWTFTNAGVGVNVTGTALVSTGNVSVLNSSTANITGLTVGTANISTANVTVANVGGATIGNIISTLVTTTNANVTLLQAERINAVAFDAETANIGSLSLDTLDVTELTVSTLNTSFANITDALVTGTFQAITVIATLTTTTNANVGLLNLSSGNITRQTVGTANISVGNVTSLTVGTLNVSSANITTATFPTVNTSSANATVASIGTLSATNATITNLTVTQINASVANLTTGTMAADPTVDLGIATKQYVDNGAGGNLVSLASFTAKGDILVGTGANTFSAQTSGSNGQVLIVDTNQATSIRYAERIKSKFSGLTMSSSQVDRNVNASQIIVYTLNEVVMDDGEVVTGWTLPATINLHSTGAGGLDGGTANANTWYEVYSIRQRSTGTKNFIIHRAVDRNPDQNTANGVQWATGTYGSIGANTTVNPNVRVAMSFTPNVSGNLTSVEIRAFKTSTPSGNMWLTLEANTAGDPSGTPLATSRKYDTTRAVLTTHYPIRFAFDNAAAVVAGTSYFWVFNSDYTASATAFMNVSFSTQAANGAGGVNPGVPKGYNGSAWVNLTPGVGTFIYKAYIEANNIPVTMPTGYDQKCLLGYFATDQNSGIREFFQKDRTVACPYSAQWLGFTTLGTAVEVGDFRTALPPVPVEAGIYMSQTGQFFGLGSLNAIDVPNSAVEGLGYVPGIGIYSVTPFVFQHPQACTIRSSTNYKFYVRYFTF